MNRRRLIALTTVFLVLGSLCVSCLGMGSTQRVEAIPVAPIAAPMVVGVPMAEAPAPIEAPVVYLP